MADAVLAAQPWYHGLLPREELKTFLKNDGDFLVRMSEPAFPGKREFVLSIKHEKGKGNGEHSRSPKGSVLAMLTGKDKDIGLRHFIINKAPDGQFYIESRRFRSVPDLVNYHHSSRTSLTSNEEVFLKTPVGKQTWQLDHSKITCTKKLGEGAFGEVHKGTLMTALGTINVAIKQAKLDKMTKEDIREFMREARLMRTFDHPNVTKLYGVAAGQEPIMMVMDLASNGALNSFLEKNYVAPDKKIEMWLHAAWGVEYLHEKNVLHRDLACRNCLYGDGKVKIADFGLSRIGTFYQMDPKKRVPIKWLAPETIRTAAYSQKTDVWSFGIMCWEVYNGKEPYQNIPATEMIISVRDQYYRLPVENIHKKELQTFLIKYCWAESPNNRMSMCDIAKELEKITKIPRPDFAAMKDEKDNSATMKLSASRMATEKSGNTTKKSKGGTLRSLVRKATGKNTPGTTPTKRSVGRGGKDQGGKDGSGKGQTSAPLY